MSSCIFKFFKPASQELQTTTEDVLQQKMPPQTLIFAFFGGPTETTLDLAKLLKKHGISGVHFLTGERILGHPDVLDGLLNLDQQMANGTFTLPHHRLFHEFSVEKQVAELVQNENILDEYGLKVFFTIGSSWIPTTHLIGQFPKPFLQRYKGPLVWQIGDRLKEQASGNWNCAIAGNRPIFCKDLYLKEIENQPKKNGIVLFKDLPDTPELIERLLVDLGSSYNIVSLNEYLSDLNSLEETNSLRSSPRGLPAHFEVAKPCFEPKFPEPNRQEAPFRIAQGAREDTLNFLDESEGFGEKWVYREKEEFPWLSTFVFVGDENQESELTFRLKDQKGLSIDGYLKRPSLKSEPIFWTAEWTCNQYKGTYFHNSQEKHLIHLQFRFLY
jgi:hypothetical protein